MEDYIASLSNEQRSLLSTVQSGSPSDVDLSLAKFPNFTEDTTFSYVLLVAGLHRGDWPIYTSLIEKGCNVISSFKTNCYETPLYCALLEDDPRTFKKLHKKGASIHAKDANSETPLELAMTYSYFGLEYFIFSEQNYDNVNPDCKEDVAVFHAACSKGSLEFVKKFVERNFSVNSNSDFRREKFAGATPLQLALQGHCTETVKFLLQLDVDFNVQDERGNTILHSAIEKLDKEPPQPSYPMLNDIIIRAYLHRYDRTKFKNPTNQDGLSHFHVLCSLDSNTRYRDDSDRLLEVLKHFIEKGVDVNSTNNSKRDYESNRLLYYGGFTALHFAARKCSLSVLKLLLENGADPTKTDATGSTPLHILDFKNPDSVEITKLLLKHGANVDAKNNQNDTPLHLAFYAQKRNETLMQLLLSASHEVSNLVNNNGLSYLHIASTRDLDKVKILIEHGASIKNCMELISGRGDFWNYSVLHFAIDFNNVEIVEYLLAQGAEVNSNSDELESTPLEIACVKQLMNLYESSDSNYKFSGKFIQKSMESEKDTNADLIKSRSKQLQIIEMLLKQGALINVQGSLGMTPLFAVCDFQSLVTSNSRPSYDNPRYKEIVERQKLIIDILLRYGVDINLRGESGKSLLHVLFDYSQDGDGRVDLAEFLLKRGAKIDTVDDKGFTPLHYAVMDSTHRDDDGEVEFHNDLSFIHMFLKYKANINSRSHNMSTPLHTAVRRFRRNEDREEIFVKLLNDPEIEIDLQDKLGETPLHVAIRLCKVFCITKLLDAGANVNIANAAGQSPICALLSSLKKPSFYGIISDNNKRRACSTIVIHIKKLIQLNCFVNEEVIVQFKSIIELIKVNFSTTDSQIGKEVEKLKSTKIDSYTSLFQILTKDPNDIAKHAKNGVLEKLISSNDVAKEFPNFSGLLETQYKKGVSRSLILEPAKAALRSITKTNWPNFCSEQILRHLSYNNLKLLTKSTSIAD